MKAEMKQLLLVKLQEIAAIVRELPAEEATLFDQIADTPEEDEAPAQEPVPEKPARAPRKVATDGTMTAITMSRKLTKELGMPISVKLVNKVCDEVGAVGFYSESQHATRYTPDSVSKILTMFRTFYKAV